ncbi:hypothetical protein B0H10DRAFT_2222254 [Mycena sp. CBHHK59/15]|nr:hypothetical protein B0H10DRAFT_2222254 [Mycena sp. CBHHK59/15]
MVFIQNGTPSSPKGTHPSPLFPTNKENYGPIPPRPDYGNIPRCPSDAWLKNPAYIDGAVNPPIFYSYNDEIVRTMLYWNPGHPMFQALAPPPTPTPQRRPLRGFLSPHKFPSIPPFWKPPRRLLPPQLSSRVRGFTIRLLILLIEIAAPLELAGYQVSVIEVRPAPDKPTTGRNGKPAARKEERESKFDYIQIDAQTRCDFITSFLKVHDCDEEYSPGVHHGPPFKMSWTGSGLTVSYPDPDPCPSLVNSPVEEHEHREPSVFLGS